MSWTRARAIWLLSIAIFLWIPRSWAAEVAGSPTSEAEVRAVEVWLSIHRGGTRSESGDREPSRGARVEGRAVYHLAEPASAGQVLHLLDFAHFMDREPVDLDEITLAGYVAGPFRPGRLEVEGHAGVEALRRVGERGDLVMTLEAGVREVELRYEVRVPHRYWPFGCVRWRCSLSGALAPLPSAPAEGGRYLPDGGRVVRPARWWVRRAAFAPAAVSRRATPPPPGRPYEVVVTGTPGRRTLYPSVFWGPRWFRTRRIFAGVEVEVLHRLRRPSGQVPDETVLQLRRDVPGNVIRIADELSHLAQTAGLTAPEGTKITVVEGPLRSAIAEPHPDAVLVSDLAMQLLPSSRLLKFHQEAIARALGETLIGRTLTGRHDPSTELWLTGQMGFALLDLWRRFREHPDEFAADILRNLTFVPAVDRFLYTQQASFSQTYFRGVDDDPPLRNHPAWFAHALPTGRRIYEKLRDTLTAEQLGNLYDDLFDDLDANPRVTAERAYGYDLGWFYDQWLGPYPSVDYSIAAIETEEGAHGGYDHRIVIRREGTDPVIEPVHVLVTERGGENQYLVWNGELGVGEPATEQPSGGTHTFELHTEQRIKSVRIDPRSRLRQTPQPPHENVDPLFNDLTPPAFRFLYTGASFNVAASELFGANTLADSLNAISGFISFEGSFRRDLRGTGHLLVSRDRESKVSAGVGANFWFGAKVNQQRRRSRVQVFVTTSWLNDNTLDPVGGIRISERLSVADDTRKFGWWPERGRRLSLGVTVRQVIRTDGDDDDRYDMSFDASWTHLWRIAKDHVVATYVAMGVVVPFTRPEFRSLARVGGIGGLSGYLADEAFGLGVTTVRAEYRHVFINDLRPNLLHLAFLRSVGGVAFAGVSTISGCEEFSGWFGEDSWYATVGYGLTAYLSILGVTPQLLRVEIGVPLIRHSDVQCLGETLPDYLGTRQGLEDASALLRPYNINVLFGHAF